MARQFAKISVTIAEDEELESLSLEAQWLYFRILLPDPGLTPAGVGDWRPKRLIHKANNATIETLRAAAMELDEAGFAYFDEGTDEYLIRSKMRHDESLRNWKCAVSFVRTYREMASKRLRASLVRELHRIRLEQPHYPCWSNEATASDLAGILEKIDWANDYQSGYHQHQNGPESLRTREHENMRTGEQENLRLCEKNTSTASGRAAPRKRSAEADQPYSDEFESWWKIYPRRAGGKRKAFAAYTRARTKVDDRCLMDAAMVYSDSRVGEDPRFTAHPTTWLNQERWNDEIVKKKSASDITDVLRTKLKERIEREEQRQLGQ